MKCTRVLTVLLSLAVVYVAFPPNSKGDEWNKKTKVTINAPIEVPGLNRPLVLDPGTYLFKLMDSTANQNVVEIWNKDRTKLITTILAFPDYRVKTPSHTIIQFEERTADAPEALKDWFYPGDNFGWEFVYPRVRAIEIAKANHENVLSTRETSREPHRLRGAHVTAVTPEGADTGVETAANPKPSQ
jgi:hypothetical protein